MIKTLLGKYFWGHLASQISTIAVAWLLHVPGMGWASTAVGVSVGFLHSLGHIIADWYRLSKKEIFELSKVAVVETSKIEAKV